MLLSFVVAWSPTGQTAEAAAAPNTAETILLTVEGKVEVARQGSPQWMPGRTNQVLNLGDLLRTGLRSRATVQLSDLTVLRVNELTSMEIQPPRRPGAKPELNQRSGSIYFFNREQPADVHFRAPNASGAIRGTEFHLAVEASGRTVLTLLDGEVSLTNELGEIALRTGEQGIIEPGQPPRKTAVIDTIHIIQWALYYPAVIDPLELGLTDAEQTNFADSLSAYRAGDLLGALQAYPGNRQPGSDAERAMLAALALAAGQVDLTEALSQRLPATNRVARALRLVIAVVKNQDFELDPPPASASELLAQSYSLQSRSRLEAALEAARAAAEKATSFGAAWIRVAELEFSFGRTGAAAAFAAQRLGAGAAGLPAGGAEPVGRGAASLRARHRGGRRSGQRLAWPRVDENPAGPPGGGPARSAGGGHTGTAARGATQLSRQSLQPHLGRGARGKGIGVGDEVGPQ
jgi:hypothetical protein